jgi:hypothetical protein
VAAQVSDGVRAEIDVGVQMMSGVALGLFLICRLEFVLVMKFVQVGVVFKLGFQVGVFQSGGAGRVFHS